MLVTSALGDTGVQFESGVPILHVRDLATSLHHYVHVLGFRVSWRDAAIMACVTRGSCRLFLCQGDQGHAGGWVWIGVDDAARLHDEWREAGAVIRMPPTNFPWAYEFHAADPDGNVLRCGSESRDGEPYGRWLDMHGKSW